MKTLVYIPVGLNSPELEILLSKCQKILNKKEKLVIIRCSGHNGYACSKNIFFSKNICSTCKHLTNKGIEKLSGDFEILHTPKILLRRNFKNRVFSKENIKNIKYKKFDLGASIYSSYIGLSRDHELDGYLSQSALERLSNTSKTFYDFFENYLNKNKISKIILYNGRHNEYRPLLRIAQMKKIKSEIMEFSGDGKNGKGVRSFFNHLPTDINYLYELIVNNWIRSKKKIIVIFFSNTKNKEKLYMIKNHIYINKTH